MHACVSNDHEGSIFVRVMKNTPEIFYFHEGDPKTQCFHRQLGRRHIEGHVLTKRGISFADHLLFRYQLIVRVLEYYFLLCTRGRAVSNEY